VRGIPAEPGAGETQIGMRPLPAVPDETGALRRAVGCAYAVLKERDPERQRAAIAANTLMLLDATVVRAFVPSTEGDWQLLGDQTTALPPLAARMEAELLPRALAAGRSLLSSHPSLDPALARLACDCEAARVTTHLLLAGSERVALAAFAVHWIGSRRPPFEARVGFYYFWDTIGLALSATQERQRIEGELARLRRRAFWDPLTGLPNTLALEDELRRQAETDPLAVLVLDFDGMREANTAFGFTAGGDVLIRMVGEALAQLAQPDEFAARMHTAGDEFVLVLPDAGADTASIRAVEIEEALDALTPPETHRGLYHGASVGFAARQPSETPGQTLGRAIEAMRERKRQRRQDH
jgi:diguanylate cyclase (GGDEF)-like protein